MIIKAKYFNLFKNIVGKKEEKIELDDNATLEDLVWVLEDKYGKKLTSKVFNKEGELSPHVNINIKGENIRDLDFELTNFDEVYFFVTISGG